MKQIALIVLIVGLVCCKQEKSKFGNSIGIKHDTVIVKKEPFVASLDSTIQTLVMEYYTAGWMDASNKLIDLYNEDRFTNYEVKRQRNRYLEKMRQQIASKK